MDAVGQFASLQSDLASALDHVGLRVPIELTREKGTSRPVNTSARELFTPDLDARVADVFAREIKAFGYEPPPRDSPTA